jgi:hypothetical protein
VHASNRSGGFFYRYFFFLATNITTKIYRNRVTGQQLIREAGSLKKMAKSKNQGFQKLEERPDIT